MKGLLRPSCSLDSRLPFLLTLSRLHNSAVSSCPKYIMSPSTGRNPSSSYLHPSPSPSLGSNSCFSQSFHSFPTPQTNNPLCLAQALPFLPGAAAAGELLWGSCLPTHYSGTRHWFSINRSPQTEPTQGPLRKCPSWESSRAKQSHIWVSLGAKS